MPRSQSTPSRRPPLRRRGMHWGTILILVCVVLYGVSRPYLEQRFGLDLPSLSQNDESAESAPEVSPDVPDDAAATAPATTNRDRAPSESAPTRSEASTSSNSETQNARGPPLGELRDAGGSSKRSTAGLLYTPGSEEGHRIDHVMRHSRDMPQRPIHGVFEGSRQEILALIDEAYVKTLEQQRDVTSEREGSRTVYTIEMNRTIGYVGGQAGKRRDYPKVSKIRLVLEGNRVITGFPVER